MDGLAMRAIRSLVASVLWDPTRSLAVELDHATFSMDRVRVPMVTQLPTAPRKLWRGVGCLLIMSWTRAKTSVTFHGA